MYPATCDYYRAASVEEAIGLLAEHADAKLIAGGHSLIPMMKLRLASPPALVDIGRIAELRGIEAAGDSIRVGALTTHALLYESPELAADCPLLAEAAGTIGDPQVRNRGTIGGNIAHADPASDLPAVLVALGATVHLAGPGGARSVAAADFFVDLLTTALAAGEVIVAVEVPKLGAGTGSAYLKFEHPASGYAVCGAAAVVTMKGGKCEAARLAYNGVTATPLAADAVTGALAGGAADDAAIDAAVDGHLAVPDPLGDAFASGSYRAELAKAYGKRALRTARGRASG